MSHSLRRNTVLGQGRLEALPSKGQRRFKAVAFFELLQLLGVISSLLFKLGEPKLCQDPLAQFVVHAPLR